jgi:DNA-binding NarL/FixJ family response regulator
MEPIRLLLAIKDALVRAALRTLLEEQANFQVIAETNSGSDAVMLALELRPGVVIMDISLQGMDGLGATRVLLAHWPVAIVLIVTAHEDKYYFWEMLLAGASGYVTQQAEPDDLVHAIHAAKEGKVYLQPVVAGWLLDGYRFLAGHSESVPPQSKAHFESLSILNAPEREVLRLVAKGLTNREIGDRLNITPHAVGLHREEIMHKLNLKSRKALIKFGILAGMMVV